MCIYKGKKTSCCWFPSAAATVIYRLGFVGELFLDGGNVTGFMWLMPKQLLPWIAEWGLIVNIHIQISVVPEMLQVKVKTIESERVL